ncbi:anti-FecI sigma factor, FecR [Fibrella aestuarina BUZ 2]|uniref:Anti-FecI sigma factor, FecR n=1 Tax=Fibrella aestuarina BUZ 2 TaxID=1166018 RepID=I0K8B5_9BACT|nr:FecR domain-containing protein [Fibrella aestuarina]CCH00368.1 anti-FecI sigma factor, FecR [Fibrella aestuarina BUZ 2]
MNQQEREAHLRAYLSGKETADGKALFDKWADRLMQDQLFLDSLSPEQLSRFEAEIWSGITQRTGISNEPLAAPAPFSRQPADDQPLRALGPRFSYRYGMAAAVVLLLLAGYVLWWMAGAENHRSDIAYRTVSVPVGGRMMVTLADGSRITLNAKSTLRYPERLTGSTRQVFLTGEGFFEVTPDPAHPFIVTTRTLTTTVKGTSFNVNAYADDPTAEVTVVTGKVAVAPSKGRHRARLLTPGQAVAYRADIDVFTPTVPIRPTDATAWQRGTLLFQRTPLSAVVRQLERQFDVHIRLENNQLARCTLVGEFGRLPLADILTALCQSIGATYNMNGTEIRIRGNGCR